MLVRDVLKAKGRDVIQIDPEATVRDALALFVEHNIGSLPVVDSEGRIVGIFSERDVLFGLHEDCESFHRQHISQRMTRDPITCGTQDSVHDVMGKISRHRVGQLPVLDKGLLVGVVSVGDLIKAMYESVETENNHLKSYVYGQT